MLLIFLFLQDAVSFKDNALRSWGVIITQQNMSYVTIIRRAKARTTTENTKVWLLVLKFYCRLLKEQIEQQLPENLTSVRITWYNTAALFLHTASNLNNFTSRWNHEQNLFLAKVYNLFGPNFPPSRPNILIPILPGRLHSVN